MNAVNDVNEVIAIYYLVKNYFKNQLTVLAI